ncbi:MFS transporter [Desulfobacterales bacterium HSG16]|nr:MFS transporter [Desulfobacterales bacterium HSG16]
MKNDASEPNKWIVFSFVAAGVFISTLDGSIVNIVLPAIMADLHVSMDTIEWVQLIYLLILSSTLLSFGRLSDIKGRRRLYVLGMIIFSVGSLFCGLSETAFWLILFRGVQGIGAAMIMSCTPALLIETFPAAERGRALGTIGAVVASGLTLGPCLGGIITQKFSWQMIFFVNIPIGIITSVSANRILKGGKTDVRKEEPFDLPGAVLIVCFLAPLLYSATSAYKTGYTSWPTLFFFSLSLVSFAALILLESKSEYPVIDLALLRIRLFILPAIAGVIAFAALFTMIFLMPFYLMHPCGLSINQAGWVMITPFAMLFIFSPISGALSDRIGSRFLCTLGMVILMVALFFLSRIPSDADIFSIIWPLALAGIGTAVFISPNSSITMSAVPLNRKGVAAGTVATARNLGMILGIAAAATIFNTVFFEMSGGLTLKIYRPELEQVFMKSYSAAMTAGAVIASIGVVISFLRGPEDDLREKILEDDAENNRP